jgi:archaellum component FlaC
MTTDERLDKLVERHEALTQSVELLTKDVHELRVHADATDRRIREVADIVSQLAKIAQRHEHRLDRLEGNP